MNSTVILRPDVWCCQVDVRLMLSWCCQVHQSAGTDHCHQAHQVQVEKNDKKKYTSISFFQWGSEQLHVLACSSHQHEPVQERLLLPVAGDCQGESRAQPGAPVSSPLRHDRHRVPHPPPLPLSGQDWTLLGEGTFYSGTASFGIKLFSFSSNSSDSSQSQSVVSLRKICGSADLLPYHIGRKICRP